MMKRDPARKGAELSMNVIIIAVICLLVLVIVAYMLTDGFKTWSTKTACYKAGGQCVKAGFCESGNILFDYAKACSPDVCCRIVSTVTS